MNVEQYVDALEEPMKAIVQKLRLAVKNVSSEFVEEIKWKVPTYSLEKNICSIMSHKKHVNLQIFQGANIRDASELLGSGKGMRHLRYENVAEVNEEDVARFVEQALDIG